MKNIAAVLICALLPGSFAFADAKKCVVTVAAVEQPAEEFSIDAYGNRLNVTSDGTVSKWRKLFGKKAEIIPPQRAPLDWVYFLKTFRTELEEAIASGLGPKYSDLGELSQRLSRIEDPVTKNQFYLLRTDWKLDRVATSQPFEKDYIFSVEGYKFKDLSTPGKASPSRAVRIRDFAGLFGATSETTTFVTSTDRVFTLRSLPSASKGEFRFQPHVTVEGDRLRTSDDPSTSEEPHRLAEKFGERKQAGPRGTIALDPSQFRNVFREELASLRDKQIWTAERDAELEQRLLIGKNRRTGELIYFLRIGDSDSLFLPKPRSLWDSQRQGGLLVLTTAPNLLREKSPTRMVSYGEFRGLAPKESFKGERGFFQENYALSNGFVLQIDGGYLWYKGELLLNSVNKNWREKPNVYSQDFEAVLRMYRSLND